LTRDKNYAQGSRFNPQIIVSFFNELAIEKKTMLKASVSFFNELSTEKRNYARELCFIFEQACHREEKLCSWFRLDHDFQEDNSLEGYHVKGQNSVMASKRSSLDGRESL
jgi:hypothetical protein